MEIKQLSSSGFKISNIFDDILLDKIEKIIDTFTPLSIRETLDRPDLPCPPTGARREVYQIDDTLKLMLMEYFSKITNSLEHPGIVELWRDYPGYTNELHYDNTIVKNVLIMFVDGVGQTNMGTIYFEDNQEYRVEYEKNSGLFLLNSDKILHGMGGSVSGVAYRKVLYANWIHHNEK